MNDPNDDNLDRLLREHFSRTLDGQLGKALPMTAGRPRRRFALYAGLAMAAGLAVVVFIMSASPKRPSESVVSKVASSQPLEYELAWQTTDAGTVYLDDTPMRRVQRRQVESVKWVDPTTHAEVELTIPHDETMLIALNAI